MAISRRDFLKKAGAGLAAGTVLTSAPALAAAAGGTAAKTPGAGAARSKYQPLEFDVAVVGAGPSGITAAIAAARTGAKVVLLEEDLAPGGAPVDMFVTFMCGGPRVGLFRQLVQTLNGKYPVGGIPSDTFGEYGSDRKNHWWLPSFYMQAYQDMIAAQPGITLMCGAPVHEAVVADAGNRNRVRGVRIVRGGTMQEIRARVTVDATGTGAVAASAGCTVMFGSEARSDYNESFGLEVSDGKIQPCTQMFISQRVRRGARFPIDAFGSGVLEDNNRNWAQEQPREEFERNDTGIFLHWGLTAYCPDTTDLVQVAEAQRKVMGMQRKNLQVLQDAGWAVHLAPKIGVREARRIKGETVVTVDDVFKGTQPDDKIADAHYAIDAWGWNIPHETRTAVKPYGIPYRALIPLGTEGLLTAGRIISGTRLAHSSYRVQPICSSIGEAAGTAAAMAALSRTGVRDIEIGELIADLGSHGLFDGYK